jgi:hypothetical protein
LSTWDCTTKASAAAELAPVPPTDAVAVADRAGQRSIFDMMMAMRDD